MANKFGDGKIEPKELASQLRKPSGIVGKKVGEQMNEGNKQICRNTYKVLAPSEGDKILEIGMGNGLFIKELLGLADGLHVTGLDYSSTMVEESIRLNESLIQDKKAEFVQGSIEKLPFKKASFNSITTTNTLYFWPDPENCAKELLRVLKPGGKALIAFRDKAFLDQIEATKFGFQKYTAKDCEQLLERAGFINISTIVHPEDELDFNGKIIQMEGNFTVGYKP